MRQFAAILILWLCGAVHLCAQQTFTLPNKPVGGYVLDDAGMLSEETIRQINQISDGAKRTVSAPIVVVTIPSLASVGADSVEWYATTLFNAWAIGDRRTNRGVLVLVARDDRKARIEMGAGWGYARDEECQDIMDGWMVPNFKQGNYSEGILRGVMALDQLVRTGKAPRPPLPLWFWPGIGGLGVLIFFLILDLAKNGMNGWGGKFLRGLGRLIIEILSSAGRSGGSSSGGFSSGGFSGGGFSGGGFSGGGGASGSW
jgi:uncharacterized protein